MLGAILLLECPPVLDIIQAKVGGNHSSQERHQGPLLQLVVEDGCVRFTGGSNSQPNTAHILSRGLRLDIKESKQT